MANSELDKSIAEQGKKAQVSCALHVVKNSAAGLVGVEAMLERKDYSIEPLKLAALLKMSIEPIQYFIEQLENGNSCSLPHEECKFVGPLVNCPRYPKK